MRVASARTLFDLCAGFVYSQILYACVELDLFAIVLSGPKDCRTIAARTGLDEQVALRLLKARRGAAPRQGAPGRPVRARRSGRGDDRQSRRSGPSSRHHDLLYADLADPVALLRGKTETRLSRFWSYPEPARRERRRRRRGRRRRRLQRADVADAGARRRSRPRRLSVRAPPEPARRRRRRRRLRRRGGAARAIARADAVRPPAGRRRGRATSLRRSGWRAASTVTEGDVLRDRLPHGADVATLVRVLHDHDDESGV